MARGAPPCYAPPGPTSSNTHGSAERRSVIWDMSCPRLRLVSRPILLCVFGSMTDEAMAAQVPIQSRELLETRGLIAGEWRSAKDNKTFPVYEPSSGDVLRQCSDLGHDDFLEAIDSAHVGYREFSKSTTAKERGALLRRWHELMMANVEDCTFIPIHKKDKSSLTVASCLQWLLSCPWRMVRP